MIHVYALVDAGGPMPELPGIDDRRLEVRTDGAVAAVLSRHDEAPEPTAEALLRHATVIEALQQTGAQERAVLPARFGSGVPDEAAVDELLAQPGLASRLDRVRGRVEIDVRLVAAGTSSAMPAPVLPAPVLPATPEPLRERSGRAHLRALAARAARSAASEEVRQAAIEQVRSRLETHADAVVERAPGSTRVVRHIALLVQGAGLASFEQTVVDLAAELAPAHTVLCTGPWPPYNFVQGPGAEPVR